MDKIFQGAGKLWKETKSTLKEGYDIVAGEVKDHIDVNDQNFLELEKDLKNMKIVAKKNLEAGKVLASSILQSSVYTIKIANEFVLEKLLKQGNCLTMKDWAERIVKLRQKMQSVIDEPPVNIQQFVPSLCNIKAISQLKVLSQQEIDAFMKAAEMCYSEEHHRNMIDIIKEEEPSLDWKTKEFRFDINRLRLSTVYRLRDYMKDALQKEGKQYPEE